MRAAVLDEPETALRVETICKPQPRVSGIGEAVGVGVLTCAAGDQVVAGFLTPCGLCRSCARGGDDLCSDPPVIRASQEAGPR